jgi:hypothetical protein
MRFVCENAAWKTISAGESNGCWWRGFSRTNVVELSKAVYACECSDVGGDGFHLRARWWVAVRRCCPVLAWWKTWDSEKSEGEGVQDLPGGRWANSDDARTNENAPI